MKIFVFAHRLEVGGSQVNAIELSARLRDYHGHDVVLFATPGPSLSLVEEHQLRFIPAPDAKCHPSLARMSALRDAVRRERPDLIHVWDWPQCLDTYYVAHLLQRFRVVVSDMTMGLSRLLPKRLPTTFGTPQLVDRARAAGRHSVELVVPPVDIHRNAPGAVDSEPFRARYGIGAGDVTLVTVSRLTEWMKAESLRRTIDVVRRMGKAVPLRFLIVGDGNARPHLERLAREANDELKRPAVVLTGALIDPRPAYASADIVVGMGGSALRGMAFGKPVLIVGSRGFCVLLRPETADAIYYNGIYGEGAGDGDDNNRAMTEHIRGLVEDPMQLRALGGFSRQFVAKNFALEVVGATLEAFLRAGSTERFRFYAAAADGIRTAAVMLGRKVVPETIRRRDRHTAASFRLH